jgi:hypothetical protein
MLAESISLVPKNQHFIHRIEFTTVVKVRRPPPVCALVHSNPSLQYYYGRVWHALFQVFINITLQSYNIASIIITAQALDSFFVYLFHKTFALEFYPHFHVGPFTDVGLLYGDTNFALSLGYLVAAAICIPQGMINLDSNVKIAQTVSFAFLVVLFGEFVGFFIWQKPVFSGRVPPLGECGPEWKFFFFHFLFFVLRFFSVPI